MTGLFPTPVGLFRPGVRLSIQFPPNISLGLLHPADRDSRDWVSPVSQGGREVTDPVNARVDMNVTFSALRHSAAAGAAALSAKNGPGMDAHNSSFRSLPAS